MSAKSTKDESLGKPAASEVVRYPKALEEWAASSKRHALDPYLEDVNALIEQGVDAEGDRSVRVVRMPPNEESNGRRRVVVIGTLPEAVDGTMRDLREPFHLEGVLINRPSKEMMAQLAQRMNGLTAATLPPAKAAAAPARALPQAPSPATVPRKAVAKPSEPARSCTPTVDPSPKEGVYVRVKDERNKRVATSPVLSGVQAGVAWARDWNDDNPGFPATLDVVRDGTVWRSYERKRSALSVA